MTQPDTALNLDARYGRPPARRARWAVIVLAATLAVAFAVWLAWGGLFGSANQFEATDTGHTVMSDSAVSVTWEFSVQPGSTARCALQALNSSFAIVGWKIVDVPASTVRSQTLTEVVRTSELAVSGLIYRCWLT